MKGTIAGLIVGFTAAFAVIKVVAPGQAGVNPLLARGGTVRQLAGGLQFAEGPVWIAEPDGGFLLFSDIPAEELKRWDPVGGLRTFRKPSGSANGNAIDREGRLVTAEKSGRVSRTEKDGTVVTLAETFEGKKLSAPNDVVVKSDGTIWFSDPAYMLAGRQQETPGTYVYRYDPASSRLSVVVRNLDRPNGLCFSPDEKILYVADSGGAHDIHAFPVRTDGTLDGGHVFATVDRGLPDGIRADDAGRVWSSSGDGVQIFSTSGTLIARILLPEAAANLAFGGPNGTTLFMTARTSLYSIETVVRQARRPGY